MMNSHLYFSSFPELEAIPLSESEEHSIDEYFEQAKTTLSPTSQKQTSILSDGDEEFARAFVPSPTPYPTRIPTPQVQKVLFDISSTNHQKNKTTTQKPEPTKIPQRKVRFSSNIEAAPAPVYPQSPTASLTKITSNKTSYNESKVEQAYVTTIRHNYRTPAKIQQGLSSKENEPIKNIVQPSMNSTKIIERKIRALESQQFEREAVLKELEPEIHKRVTQHASKALNFDNKTTRYYELTSINEEVPAVKPRQVKKQVSAEYVQSLQVKPTIEKLKAMQEPDVQIKKTSSSYCVPVAVTMGSSSYASSTLNRFIRLRRKDFSYEDLKPL